MDAAEYQRFRARSVAGFARDKVAYALWDGEGAEARASAQFDAIAPAGLATPGCWFFNLVAEGEAQPVGFLFLAEREEGGRRGGYIYDIGIFDRYQRRGYATRALAALERFACSQGFEYIDLHVFGGNEAAIALYQRSGFAVTGMQMRKPLANTAASLTTE